MNAEKSQALYGEEKAGSRVGYPELGGADPSAIIGLFIRHLEAEHGFSREKLRKLVAAQKSEVRIPLSVFSSRLSSLETVVKYMSENLGLKNSEISRQLGRNLRTTWTTYRNANRKSPERLIPSETERFHIPASALADRRLSTLEAIVSHLKESYALSLREIARLLDRDDSTIWTVYNRARKKEILKRKTPGKRENL